MNKSKSLKFWTMVVSAMTAVCLCWYAVWVAEIVVAVNEVGWLEGIMFLVLPFFLWPLNLASSVGLVLTAYLMGKNGLKWLSNFLLTLFVLNAVYGIYLFFLVYLEGLLEVGV